MEGSFFTESDLSEQDRHRLDCVTRFEGTLVEKAGLHPLALGPNRKLDRLVATSLRTKIGDLTGPDHRVYLLSDLLRIDSLKRYRPASSDCGKELVGRDRAQTENAAQPSIMTQPDR
jgi:hypothetical protein